MTDGPDAFGFPPPERLPQLRWLGPDYISVLVYDLTRGLLRQDPGTRVVGVRCDAEPVLKAVVDSGGVIRSHDVTFSLQILLRDGTGCPWRLHGLWTYSGRDLGTPAASIDHHWALDTAERR